MKNKFLIVVITILLACEQRNTSTDETDKSEFNHTSKSPNAKEFWIDGINKEDFSIIERGDTIFYKTQLYEGIEGKKIKFDRTAFADIQASIRYNLGFLQYTTDDVPAFPLAYTKRSRWADLKIENGWVKIPDHYGDANGPAAFEVLGYKSKEDLLNWILAQDFKMIRKKSLHEQTIYYTNIIKEKNKYGKCCPEYIEQANNFLSRPANEYNSIDKLGLEQNFKLIIIVITGHLKSGEEFKKVIVGQ